MEATSLGPSRTQAIQGCLRDAWLIAALGAIAGHRPEVIRRVLRKHPSGDAHIELHQVALDRRTADWVPTGQPIVLELSPELPLNPYSPRLSYYADTGYSRVIWPALLEKAFAAIDAFWSTARRETVPERGYQRLDLGGNEWEAAEILAQLTGERAGVITLGRHPENPEEVETVLRYLLLMKRPVLIGSAPRTDAQGLAVEGIYPAHVYEITRVRNGRVDLRNPWGALDPTGIQLRDLLANTRGSIVTIKE